MFVTWYTPVGFLLWTILVINGFFTAINGPIMQSMPVLLPEIGDKYAGSAGGIVGTISLLMSYFLPIGISAIAGADYTMNMGLEPLLPAFRGSGFLPARARPQGHAGCRRQGR